MPRTIADESGLLASVQTTLPPARQVLAFAPHPDDEVFGCGGLLALLRRQGSSISVIVVTDGAAGGDDSRGKLVPQREAESRAAASLLEIPGPTFWRLPDRGLAYGEPLVERIATAITAAAADLVLLPAPTELHPDHQTLALAGAEAVRRLGGDLRALFYEINQPLPAPNLLLDITPVFGLKQAAMACFGSQLAEQPYQQRIAGLNRFRAYFLGPRAEAAEAYLLLEATALQPDLPRLFDGPLAHRRRQGYAADGKDLPLVSVIVRSMDRPTLARALDSLALQTWPNLEVVVVNAKGGDHTPPGEYCGPFPLRVINQGGEPLRRSAAANRGLAACRGQYIGFLDDDDTIDPDHIHHLVTAILTSFPVGQMAYSGVRGLQNGVVTTEFKTPHISFARLLFGNCLPIHGVLFSQRLLENGACFDEAFDLYEDWDFWLQLTRQTTPLYLNRITATYHAECGSGVGMGVTTDPSRLHRATEQLAAKWLSLLAPHELVALGDLYRQTVQQLAEKDQQLAEKDQQLAEKDQQLAEKDQQLAEKDQQLAEKDQQLTCLYASRSWRVTAPLRLAGGSVRTILRGWRELRSLYTRHGGARAIAAKTVAIVQREGVAGLTFRLRRLAAPPAAPGPSPQTRDYTEWIRRYDTLHDEERFRLRAKMQSFAVHPLISVIMPVYNPDKTWLVEALDSVRNQLYPNWELCLADDASSDPEIRPLLTEYANQDPRIKVLFREENGHISAASNSALSLATGEWIALLDQDDLLSEHALLYLAEAINRHPDAGIFYSDEDKLDAQGKRWAPYFKCDWNRALFYSHNLITHLGVFRADIVRRIGGFRQDFNGAQDYDLALRCTEQLSRQQIVHIPRVLYHWRMHAKSTALAADAKPYAMLAGERALNDHLSRIGINGRAELVGHGFRVRYPLPAQPPLVSLIIPTRNGLGFLRRTVESILVKTTYPTYEIIIIDNASDDPKTLTYLEHLEKNENRVRVIRDEREFNYSALNNEGVRQAAGTVVGLLNNDLEVITPDWLSEMVSLALQPEVGAVGALLLYPDNTIQHGGVIVGIGGWAGHAHKGFPRGSIGYAGRASLLQEFSAVTGACLVVRKALYEQVGGLDEQELRVACNDVDLCLRLRAAGFYNIWTPYAELYHHESATRGYEDTPEKKARFAQEVAVMKTRWPEFFRHDPAYSPNLTLDHEDFSLAWPPRLSN